MTKLTENQRHNLQEWLRRMGNAGHGYADSVVIFNGLGAPEQQKIIRSRWYSARTAEPIRRPLLPA